MSGKIITVQSVSTYKEDVIRIIKIETIDADNSYEFELKSIVSDLAWQRFLRDIK